MLWYKFHVLWRPLLNYHIRHTSPKKTYTPKLSSWIDKPTSYIESTFTFLNLKLVIENYIDWNEKRFGKLWAYNLNYMDYILQPEIDIKKGIELIYDFVSNFLNNNIGKEPYTLALRGINWIKFISKHSVHDEVIDNSLYKQYILLLENIEYHLKGNHLLENAFSLLFASFYFRDHKMFSKAYNILKLELTEQILNDGGHFERSPMYHQLILDRLLDTINLLKNNNLFIEQYSLLKILITKASKMLSWIKELSYFNGEIPLFNDAARGVAPLTDQLLEYAERIDLPIMAVSLGESGYRRVNTPVFEARLDFGNIGPDYIPGHAHADTFSFELWLHGKPLIVDTGISTYEENERRQLERSTSAHNTVQVSGKDSSEVWGAFRVARRACVYNLEEMKNRIQARHDGYKHIGTIHERNITWDEKQVEIHDRIIKKKPKNSITRFHFHPDIHPKIFENTVIFEGGELSFIGAKNISVKEFHYAEYFNRLAPSKVINVVFNDELSSKFRFN